MEKLRDDQLETFDREYVFDRRWIPIKSCIDRDFPDGQFTFLDVGGGNGVFADRILANYPNSSGVVLDNSSLLLSRNQPDVRKRVVLDSAMNLGCFGVEKFDLIFFNWVLHHLVARSSYGQSRDNINHVLRSAIMALTGRGRVSVYENIYNGLVVDNAPSRIIYQLTSAKNIAKLIKKGGANTAGTGVCFLSYRQWGFTIKRSGFRILDYTNDVIWRIPWTWNVFLHIGHIRCGHFWLGCQEHAAHASCGPSLTAFS